MDHNEFPLEDLHRHSPELSDEETQHDEQQSYRDAATKSEPLSIVSAQEDSNDLSHHVTHTNFSESQELLNKHSEIAATHQERLTHDSLGQIILASSLFLTPLVLSAVLAYLIYANLLPTTESTQGLKNMYSIIDNNQSRAIRNTEYYVDYAATRLVFVSSLSSTLALSLVPIGMSLFAYCTASDLHHASVRKDYLRLPSPFQFELCIRMLQGGALSIYQYFCYLIKPKSRRVRSVPALNRSALAVMTFFALAIAVTIADALLHLGTTTVQYNRTIPTVPSNFLPARYLPADCLRDPTSRPCNLTPGGSGAPVQLLGVSEAYRILGNVSEKSYISLTNDGLTAVVVPATVPNGVSFSAWTFGSATTCETISGRCNPHYTGGNVDAGSSWGYNCTTTKAGVNLAQDFSPGPDALGITYFRPYFFNDSSKSRALSRSEGPSFNNPIWMAMDFYLPAASLNGGETIGPVTDYQPTFWNAQQDLIGDTCGNTYGIVSCNITLLNIHYIMAVNGSVSTTESSPMNNSESQAFNRAFVDGYGNDNVQPGLTAAGVGSNTSQQLAYHIARTIDRTILGLTTGNALQNTYTAAYKTTQMQVTKIPIPEFFILIALNTLMSASGIALTIIALYLRLKQGIVGIQTRLNIGALVVALFEEELENTAKDSKEVYAELRGAPTSRVIATDGHNDAGRFFVTIQPDKMISDT